MNESELRAKAAAAARTMEQLVREHGRDHERWSKAVGQRFDEAMRAEKRALRELEQLVPGEREEALQRQIDQLRHARMARGADPWAVSSEETRAVIELDRLQSIRAAKSREPLDDIDLERSNAQVLRIAALRAVEKAEGLTATQQEHVAKMLEGRGGVDDPTALARWVIASDSRAYRSAWASAVTRPHVGGLGPEERRAMVRAESALERRAGSEATFGVGVPWLLDSAVIGTAGGQQAPILDEARVVVCMKGDSWHGVASNLSPGYGYVSEAGVMPDDSLTLSQPTLPFYKAGVNIPVSVELLEDYGPAGFQAEMARVMELAYLSFVGQMTVAGTGSGEPYGLFPALAGSASDIRVTTLGDVGLVDVRAAWSAMPDRFRSNSVWVMHPSVLAQIEASIGGGQALADLRFTPQGALLEGRPVILSDYSPAYVNTTASSQQFCVIADLSDGFVFANRVPTTIELTSSMRDPSTGRPTLQKALIQWLRHGFGLVDVNFGRILANS